MFWSIFLFGNIETGKVGFRLEAFLVVSLIVCRGVETCMETESEIKEIANVIIESCTPTTCFTPSMPLKKDFHGELCGQMTCLRPYQRINKKYSRFVINTFVSSFVLFIIDKINIRLSQEKQIKLLWKTVDNNFSFRKTIFGNELILTFVK